MKKLKMHSPNLAQDNIARIREAFPNCVTEARDERGELKLAVDFDQLRQELSECIVEGPQERYHLNWPGKREALLTANAPIAKTLRPCREESVDFDSTKNLFIEGDNLEALKLLQETYLGKVKMIYIDPPYNRKKGNNLVYRDDFTGSSFEYQKKSGQTSLDNERLVANMETNGRFHSDWLTMMYPRLKMARNLLANDGTVFISIDDNEHASARFLCDEIFGEGNFVGTIVWKNATDNNPSNIATEHESIIVYAKSKIDLPSPWKSKTSDIKNLLFNIGNDLISKYSDPTDLQTQYSAWYRDNKAQLGTLDRYKYIDSGGVYTGSQSVHNPGKEGYRYDVLHPSTGHPCKQPLLGYRFPKTTMDRLISEDRIIFGKDHTKIVEIKVYASTYEDKLASVFELDGRIGAYDLRELFPESKRIFSNPKPVALMEHLLSFATDHRDICLDLFAGSSTLAHAVLKLNQVDRGRRRFISIQYPEEVRQAESTDSLAFFKRHGIPPLITEISKERIRRAGKKILEGECHEGWNKDVGFRVLKIDSSNLTDVRYTPDSLRQNELDLFTDHIKPDRSVEDLLFQVLLDWGVDLTLPIRRQSIQDKIVYFVDENALVACFDKNIDEDLVKELTTYQPLRVVFRDDGFASDAMKINVEQIFKQLSPTSDVKVI